MTAADPTATGHHPDSGAPVPVPSQGRPLRLLYLTEAVPNRDPVVGDGSSMIPYEVIQALPSEVQVHLACFAGDVPVPAEVAARCTEVTELPVREGRTLLLRSLLTDHDIGSVLRDTPLARQTVARLSAAADVTLVHGPHVASLIHHVQGPVVLQVVDPWSARKSMEVELARWPRRAYRRHRATRALRLERQLPERVRLLTVGRTDAEAWARALDRPVRSVPNGVRPVLRPRLAPGAPTICFVGSLNYEPNEESARVLVEEIAPQLWRARPELRILLAGRRPTPAVLALRGERVEVLADVPDLATVFAVSHAAVFPDRHGLGIRNSVAEALAAGVPVVASPRAAREQPEHPMLFVGADAAELVRLTEAVLAGSQHVTAAATPPAVGRTWETVALDYLSECTAALHQH